MTLRESISSAYPTAASWARLIVKAVCLASAFIDGLPMSDSSPVGVLIRVGHKKRALTLFMKLYDALLRQSLRNCSAYR